MDRFDESNIIDSCRSHGNGAIGNSFTLTPGWISLQTSSSHDWMLGDYYSFGGNMSNHQVVNFIDILDDAIRIVDEVFIDVVSAATNAQSGDSESAASPSEVRESH
jgi:hypothetical protein